jgi:hypothetical protein
MDLSETESNTKIIYNKKLYKNELDSHQLPRFYHRKGQNVYYKDDNAYYGPEQTYSEIPKPKNIKFLTPIKLENMDHTIYIKNHDKSQLEAYLAELEKEVYHLLIFDDEPKFVKSDDKKFAVNAKYPYAYYDTTKFDKSLRIKELKNKIIDVKKEIGIKNQEVDFFITVKNSTYPLNPDDIVTHYNESFTEVKYNNPKQDSINGNFTHLEDIYNIRKIHLIKDEKKNNNPLENYSALKYGYHNQILDFLTKHGKQNPSKPKETTSSNQSNNSDNIKYNQSMNLVNTKQNQEAIPQHGNAKEGQLSQEQILKNALMQVII